MISRICFILLVSTLWFQCGKRHNSNWPDRLSTDSLIIESANYMQRYELYGDPALLDSAMIVINTALVKDNTLSTFFIMRKICVLTMKQDYTTAIKLINSTDKDFFDGYAPFYSESIRYRLLAMKAQADGISKERNQYLLEGIKLTENFLVQNKEEATRYLDGTIPSVQLLKGPFAVAFVQNNFYFAKLYGNDKAQKRIDSMKHKHPNAEFLFEFIEDYMKEDLMTFNGF